MRGQFYRCLREFANVSGRSKLQQLTSTASTQHQECEHQTTGRGENQAVDAVVHSAVAGQQRARILHRRAALIGGFDQIAHLTGDVCQARRSTIMLTISICSQRAKRNGHEQRRQQIPERAFPGFLGAQLAAPWARGRASGRRNKRACRPPRSGTA